MIALFFIPENDRSAALRENERLWGFWEPTRPRFTDVQAVYRARDRWRNIHVEAVLAPTENAAGRTVRCRRQSDRCEYGGQAWQHFKPDFLPFNESHESVLFIHPITGWTVRAQMIVPARAKSAKLYIGLTDPSADSDNREPVKVRLLGDKTVLNSFDLQARRGLQSFDVDISKNKPKTLSLEFECEKDGARVIGWDLSFFKTSTATITP